MSEFILENESLKVTIKSMGAEISSVFGKERQKEFMWNADKKYWGRTAPVLFPVVGNFKDKEYIYDGTRYTMGQHGFARDKEFTMVQKSAEEIWFELTQDEETLKVYPFCFQLMIGYRLKDNYVEVLWKVKNTDKKDLYFSIGGHPAFLCPLNEGEEQSDYSLQFDTKEDLLYNLVNDKGLIADTNNLLPLDEIEGTIKIPEHLFDRDALIIEGSKVQKVSLLTMEKEPYITVEFDAPLFGIWSPAGKRAPFICIEPWYGRSDSIQFNGSLEEREYGNCLEPLAEFEKKFTMYFS